MRGLDKLKLRLGIAACDREKDELLALLLDRAEARCADYCRLEKGDASIADIALEMAACDYGELGSEGVSDRNVSGLSEKYPHSYPDAILAALRRLRRPGVPS